MAFISIQTAAPGKALLSLAGILKILAVRRQRRHLATLDDAALKDLGLTEADVRAEVKRPAWDVPSHWQG